MANVRRIFLWPFQAKFTAGSLVHVEELGGQVLLVRQRMRRTWSLPGGFHRRGETPLDAARRELLEETGIRPGLPLELVAEYRQEGYRHYDHVFKLNIAEHRPKCQRSGWMAKVELAQIRWFDLRGPEQAPPMRRATEVALNKATGRSLSDPVKNA
jgi:8-oxo-dGTP pyrophosphatase MutT (NUDIX family)